MRCPYCKNEFDLREAHVDQEWRKIIELLPAFGGHQRLAFEYTEKFGVTPLMVRTKKLLRLLEWVGALFAQKKFKLSRATYEISERGIVEGLTIVNNKEITTPFENHNYLKKVLASISEREQKDARSALDKDLHSREQRAKSGEKVQQAQIEIPQSEEHITMNSVNSYGEGKVLSPEENRRRAAELAGKIGKGM